MSLNVLLAFFLLASDPQPHADTVTRAAGVVGMVLVHEELALVDEAERLTWGEAELFSDLWLRYQQLWDAPYACSGFRLLDGADREDLLRTVRFIDDCVYNIKCKLEVWHGYPCGRELYRTKLELEWWRFALDELHTATMNIEPWCKRKHLAAIRDWIGEERFYGGSLIGEFGR